MLRRFSPRSQRRIRAGNQRLAETQALERLRARNAELERQLAERTQEFRTVTEELQAARAVAEQADLAKTELLARLSHELRIPLNAILGFCQLLAMQNVEHREAIDQILKAGRHIVELIDELRDLQRVEAGSLPIDVRPVAVGTVVEEAVGLTGPLAADKGIALHYARSGEGPHAAADRTRLLEILLNLVANAIAYNREGGSVEVACAAGEAVVTIHVRDTGPGLAPEDLRKLFIPFERLGARTNAGTGLGLALSRRLAEAMGGTITVESTVGVGSTFSITLPAAVAPSDGTPAAGADADES